VSPCWAGDLHRLLLPFRNSGFIPFGPEPQFGFKETEPKAAEASSKVPLFIDNQPQNNHTDVPNRLRTNM
jgi:hypothetical protein